MSNWMDDSTTEAMRVSVDKKIESFAKGDLKHATKAISSLWENANGDGDIKTPSSTLPAVS